MAEEPKNEEKVETPESTEGTPPQSEAGAEQPKVEEPKENSEEVKQLEAEKTKLEEEIRGKEGTIYSLDEDIVRKRQERKEVGEEPQQALDKDALWDEFQPKVEEQIATATKPISDENLQLKEQLAKSEQEALKAKQAALDSVNARIASVTAPNVSSNESPEGESEQEVVLTPQEQEIAKELDIKDPKYLKDIHVQGL